MATFTEITVFHVVHCANCNLAFGVPADFESRRRNDHQTFWCPSGHSNYYDAKSEEQKLRDQLAAKERELLAAKSRVESERNMRLEANRSTERVERRLRATKAVVTRTKKKIVAGKCPCCSFKVPNLKQHMATEHPKYDPDKAATAIEAKV